ncbi:MAG: ABC transporter permease [Actinomycetota bacterium]|nr:ABC transporter permease [Actinomycetota bacterium]
MIRFLALRLVHTIPVIVGITLAAFVLVHLVPGDPVRIMLGGKASKERIAEIHHELGIDRPLPVQYVDFVGGSVQGDLGESIILRRPVASVVGERLGPSIFLLAYATLIAIAIALPLGVASAVRRNRITDHAIRVATLIAFAMPAFWLGLILIRKLSLDLGAFPVSGYGDDFLGHVHHLTLPALTIGLFLASMLVRSLRSSLIDVFGAEYVEAARARGLSESRVVLKHALRNALIATVTVLAVNLGWLISSAVVIEKVFDVPGLGQLLVESIFTRDFPTIQGLTLVFGLLVIAINLLADFSYALIDPRVRLS